jgi:uncharacterized protein
VNTAAEVARLIAGNPEMRHHLRLVAELNLPDCWVGAGFIRNRLWDALNGWPPKEIRTDVDVVYFDPLPASPRMDQLLQRQLKARAGTVDWSVKNQARMHSRNGDRPYNDTIDALRHWPETATAIAARAIPGGIEVIAPYGVADLMNGIVRPTPAFANKLELYQHRIATKGWLVRWPHLQVLNEPPDCGAPGPQRPVHQRVPIPG